MPFVTSLLRLRDHPSGGSTVAEIRDFYLGEDRFFSTVFLGSGLLFVIR